jgi:hypothetical protein
MVSQVVRTRIDPAARAVLDEIEASVQHGLCGRLCDFHVTFENGGLVLCGRTHTYYAKQLAQHLVMEASDLPIQANVIEVA